MVTSKENLLAAYAFFAGVIIAVMLGFISKYSPSTSTNSFFYILLVAIGLIIGFLHTSDKNTITFLIASVSIVIVGGQGNSTLIFISNLSPILDILKDILNNLLVLFIPATIVVALKTVFSIASI
jgi:hypothetical protein